ncbi:tail sheath protein [Roseibium sp. TrichSKD4]|uniref:phage tail sheath subtilisin-like domain-containing protein n=1 Tax=Roseibium sp. TrichSKD4 TaxID=744980 RepID=UPI0001E575F7|nr:phage tail sheath subtilisin-like domain-containing protein [Roseibium sp. TrichSKD4]EFO30926.1 tail sheath protein [Roseibium sp. TrichSKD4]
MTTNYRHGVFATDQTAPTPRIRVGEAGEIFMIGTAPDADAEKWPLNVPQVIAGDISKVDSLGTNGTLKAALKAAWRQYDRQSGKIAVVRVEEKEDPAQQKAAVLGDAIDKSGVYSALNVRALHDFEPDLLIAPGFANAMPGDQADPVINGLIDVAQRIRSFVFADGPNTTTEDAISARQNYNSDRLQLVDPHCLVFDSDHADTLSIPGSAIIAGVQSSLDLEKGFWWSNDNKPLEVEGLARPIDWRISDTNAEASRLNASQVSTFYRDKGFWSWGGLSTDPARKMGGTIVGRRVADKLYDALEQGLRFYIGHPMQLQAVRHIGSLGHNFGLELMQKGALNGFVFELPEDLNTPQQIAEGILFYRLKFIEAAPIHDIEIWGYRTPELYEEFLSLAAARTSFTASLSDVGA